MAGKKSFIHQATKNATRNHDAPKLDYLQKNIPIPSIREETILDSNFWTLHATRIPDLILNPKTKHPIILEHDTFKIHGDLINPTKRTQDRNLDYVRSKRPFFIINADLAKMLGLDEAKLATYLYYFVYCQINAGVWN